MNTYSVSRLALALAFGVTLSACSSTPADQQPSTQTAPGTTARPILNADEAKNFTPEGLSRISTPFGELFVTLGCVPMYYYLVCH